ncbi:hypothetical protein [Subtercola sp. YIM 133946]|uniref:hypothetical protein n=1 Tax=Subtercola sp. YIM 133946 TaxID=3118909 RepID=UPI002F95E76F
MTATDLGSPRASRPRRGTAGWVAALIFALLYAFVAFEGLSNLIGLLQSFALVDAELSAAAVAALVGLVVVPVLVFVIILWGTRRTSTLKAALVFIAGLAAVAVLTLDLQNLFQQVL